MKISEIDKLVADNILIAKFMGWKIDNSFPDKDRVWKSQGGRTELDTTLKFHKDWNWIIPACKRSYNLLKQDKNYSEDLAVKIKVAVSYYSLELTHKTLVEFIKHFNDKVD